MIHEYLIVGSGFSSNFFKSLLKKKYKVIAPKLIDKEFYKNKKNYVFTHNKLLSKKPISVTRRKYYLPKNIYLYDHLLNGGSSNIWGGAINLEKLKNKKIFELLKITLIKLSFDQTFSISNKKNIYQMRDKKDQIYSFCHPDNDYINGFIINFKLQKNHIVCDYFSFSKKKILKIKCKKLFLATGVVQLIEILANSGYIKNRSKLSLDEYEHFFKISFSNKIKSNKTIVKYNLIGIIKHYLGYQKKINNFFKIFSFIPIYIDQIFTNKKKKIEFIFKNNSFYLSLVKKFGDSAHYHNLKINNIKINEFLKKISRNKIQVISMPAAVQTKPGPISNDILEIVLKNLKKLKVNLTF